MQYLCNMLSKNWVNKLMFYMLINMKVFYKLKLLFFDGVGQACLKYLSKFAMSLSHYKKEVRNEVNCTNWLKYYSCNIL